MSQKKSVVLAVGTALAMIGPMAFAAVDPAVQAGFDAVESAVTDYIAMGIAACLGLMAVSLAPEIGIAVGKRWVRKGAK